MDCSYIATPTQTQDHHVKKDSLNAVQSHTHDNVHMRSYENLSISLDHSG